MSAALAVNASRVHPSHRSRSRSRSRSPANRPLHEVVQGRDGEDDFDVADPAPLAALPGCGVEVRPRSEAERALFTARGVETD
ncbi:hypothetical protein [Streptomyces xantholiticus]|uniref:hypothetical protein n=1 Tax=Streptomyces xantholiticus TaxID=68285 RepID=UPI00167913A6|nr:hypothetical protein [Streptomyces xantholiticus]GGW25403.1 hypothetical protein GCM10010381_06250 [Streptomyces xantholiticus]